MHSNVERRSEKHYPLTMRTRIEDLPLVRVSTLVARGYIGRDAVTTLVQFGDESVEWGVGVRIRPFRNGGFWAMLVCPRCGGGAQRLRLLDNTPACGKCVRASGLRYRVESTSAKDRHLLTAPDRIAKLKGPARLNPRSGRRLDRRAPIEAALKRSLLVARRRRANFHGKPVVPDSLAHLDPDLVVETLSRHAINVSEAAAD
jgi:hypothetical protein